MQQSNTLTTIPWLPQKTKLYANKKLVFTTFCIRSIIIRKFDLRFAFKFYEKLVTAGTISVKFFLKFSEFLLQSL